MVSLLRLAICALALALVARPAESAPVEFNREIRPLLNAHCIKCHGGVKEAGGLNLQFRERALEAGETGEIAIVPGHPETSAFIDRLTSDDPEERMPRKEGPLPKEQVELLRRWIAEGAKWEKHWAYQPPQPCDQSIDDIVNAGLAKAGLKLAPEADPRLLARRLALDLTGLPPTPERVDALEQAPDREAALRGYVDELLASPAYGERWAVPWLDLARYADSCGFEKDALRDMWRYRDWVIDALNADLPYDRFVTEQLAGDLLPQATEEQIIATAFHRNTQSNDEGGVDHEEYRTYAVLDRVNATFDALQGTSIGCVQCHGHPYDAFVHKEYYQLVAFFNNSADADRGDQEPTHLAHSRADETKAQELEKELAAVPPRIAALLAAKPALWLPDERDQVEHYAITHPALRGVRARLAALTACKLPIMQELTGAAARRTFVFHRGNWMDKAEEVWPATPSVLNPWHDDYPRNRLGFARWLTNGENPLTARVQVNRVWEQLFGTGLVETLEDFGSQGDRPVYPELLDGLAMRFQTSLGWSQKALLREIVLSRVYRQSSKATPADIDRDPANRLLARGPRFRLTHEQIRDQALALGGLLSPKMFGQPVMPFQPPGTWLLPYDGRDWNTSAGEDGHRRALYTLVRRSVAYPSMITLDAPSREFCVVRRTRTDTPLQALDLLNSPVFMEAAAGLARRMTAPGGTLDEQLARGLALATLRPARSEQVAVLRQLHARLGGNMTLVANTILNMDEVLTKP